MNAEIYFPRNGRAFGQTSGQSFDDTIKKLGELKINIIYKTEINLTSDSVSEALSVSESGDEKIGMIFIADILSSDSEENAEEVLSSIGLVGKLKRYETKCRSPKDKDSDDDAADGKKKKKKKSRKKDSQTEKIDISDGVIDVVQDKLYFYTLEHNNKLIVLLPRHEDIGSDFSSVIYSAAKKLVAPKEKTIPLQGRQTYRCCKKGDPSSGNLHLPCFILYAA